MTAEQMELRAAAIEAVRQCLREHGNTVQVAWTHGFIAAALKIGAISLAEKHVACMAIEKQNTGTSPLWWRSPMYLCSTDPKGSSCEVVS